MTITQLPFTNGFYESDSLPLSAQSCINFYVNVPQAPAMASENLYGTPGLNQLATSGASKQINRGAWVLNGKPYFVNGENLYRLNKTVVDEVDTFALENLGSIPGTARVSMADNGTQLFILIPGGNGYIFTEDPDTLTQITDLDFTANGQPQYVVYIDGYFVLTTDSKKFIVSALNDGLSYNALDFGSAEANPDPIVAPFVFKNQLYITGTQTTEAFQNIGGSGFPFQRSGLYLSKGCLAPLAIVESNDTVMWIGAGKSEGAAIWTLSGNTTQKVSTTAIDLLLQSYSESELESVFAWSYSQKGAYFVGFALPDTTIVLDAVTGKWHERKSEVTNAKNIKETLRNRANSVVSAYGRIICGDMFDGRVGELSTDIYQEYGIDIVRRVSTMPFQNNMQSFLVPSLEMTVESGMGSDLVTDPKIRMEISRNGGKTYADDRTRGMGKIGEYKRRVVWRRNGRMSRLMVLRFTLSDPVKPVLLQLTADMETA